jgi:Glutamine amidotransferase domain
MRGAGFLIGPVVPSGSLESSPELRVWSDSEDDGAPIFMHEDADVLSACCGHLDHRELSRWGASPEGALPRLARDLLEQPELATHLSGTFGVVCVEKVSNRVVMVCDKAGIQGLYYGSKDGNLFLSSNLMLLLDTLGHTGAPNRLACFQHFAFGYPVFSDQTPYRGVKRVPPGSFVVADKTVRAVRYWSPPGPGDAVADGPLDLARCMGECIETTPGSRPFLSVTSGKDSLCLAVAARGAGVDVLTGSMGRDGSADSVLGEQVSSELGFEFVRGEMCNLSAFPDACLRMARYSAGMATLSLVDMFQFYRETVPPGCTHIIGEQLLRPPYPLSREDPVGSFTGSYMTPARCLISTMTEPFSGYLEGYPHSTVRWLEDRAGSEAYLASAREFFVSQQLPGNFSRRHGVLSAVRSKLSPFLSNRLLHATFAQTDDRYEAEALHREIIASVNDRLLPHLDRPKALSRDTQDWYWRFRHGFGETIREMLEGSLGSCSDVFEKTKVLALCDENLKRPSRDIFFFFRLLCYALARTMLAEKTEIGRQTLFSS